MLAVKVRAVRGSVVLGLVSNILILLFTKIFLYILKRMLVVVLDIPFRSRLAFLIIVFFLS